ncbi:hypothetical protein [Novosphingobium panipatense]|uniref:hypothetical protein n=1 Tax=Novosphingobium panipatense TaxID=428991 RepID=UPI00362194A4
MPSLSECGMVLSIWMRTGGDAGGDGESQGMSDRTAAETLDRHIRGRLLADGRDRAMRSVIAQIFARESEQGGFLVPAVAEPLIVWVLKGAAVVEERELGGDWTAARVVAGDFFITDSDAPYELRWRSLDEGMFEVMHLYLGLPLMEQAGAEVLGCRHRPLLSEVSGARDDRLGRYIELIEEEIAGARRRARCILKASPRRSRSVLFSVIETRPGTAPSGGTLFQRTGFAGSLSRWKNLSVRNLNWRDMLRLQE